MAHTLTDLQHLTDPQQAVLQAVSSNEDINSTFFLTGGTLLKALDIVPRQSNDLDFFSFAHIDSHTFTQRLVTFRQLLEQTFGSAHLRDTDQGWLHNQSGMLIDVIADAVPNIGDFVSFDHLKTASLSDIAAHKASAICSRDEIKDYIDLAFLTKKNNWSLLDLAALAEQKFNLGTISEEKLLTELIARQSDLAIPPSIFLLNPEQNLKIVDDQITHLIEHTTL